jgi:hypothetical protein
MATQPEGKTGCEGAAASDSSAANPGPPSFQPVARCPSAAQIRRYGCTGPADTHLAGQPDRRNTAAVPSPRGGFSFQRGRPRVAGVSGTLRRPPSGNNWGGACVGVLRSASLWRFRCYAATPPLRPLRSHVHPNHPNMAFWTVLIEGGKEQVHPSINRVAALLYFGAMLAVLANRAVYSALKPCGSAGAHRRLSEK